MQEMEANHGPYDSHLADQHFGRYLQGVTTDHLRELSYPDRKALHNFKYFTWVEQQGRSADEVEAAVGPGFLAAGILTDEVVDEWDRLIDSFNDATDWADAMR